MAKEISVDSFMSAKEVDFAGVPFEKGLQLLEELVARVEEGTLPLDQAMCAYERGVELMAHMQRQLSVAEQKLKLLRKRGPEPVRGPEDVEVTESE